MRSSGYITRAMQNNFFFKIKQEHFLGTLSSCKVSLNRRILIKKKEEIQAFSIFLETVLSRKLSVS